MRHGPWVVTMAMGLMVGAPGCGKDAADGGGPQTIGDGPPAPDAIIARAQRKIALAGRATPSDGDGDADGLADGAEAEAHRTSAASPDTDRDGLPDGFEVRTGTDPTVFDPGHAVTVAQAQQCRVNPSLVEVELVRQLLSRPCVITTLAVATCTGTCAGTCCGGLVTCGWSWDPLQWGVDKYLAAPCPGWGCFCP